MTNPEFNFTEWFQACIPTVEVALEKALPSVEETPSKLHEAMRYAVLGGGKRIRAALVHASAHAVLGSQSDWGSYSAAIDCAANAVEMIHAYSLVHDDLPCMDNDDLRRGKPTVHKQYNEAMAMLVGDALQPLAFGQLAQMPIAPALIVQAVHTLALASGSLGMAGGQAIDLLSIGQSLTQAQLQQMHSLKTGAMIEASVRLGAIVAGADSRIRTYLENYGVAIGLAFQVVDDVLDASADTTQLGKTAGKDAAHDKPTYVSVMGLEAAREFSEQLHCVALDAIKPLGEHGQYLKGIANLIVQRKF